MRSKLTSNGLEGLHGLLIRAVHEVDGNGTSGILPLDGIIDTLLDVEVGVGERGLSKSISDEGANGGNRELHFDGVDEELRPNRLV